MDAGSHNRQRKASCLLLHDSVPWELRVEWVPTTYTWGHCVAQETWSEERKQMLYPGKHRCSDCPSLEDHPSKAILYRNNFGKKNSPNPRQPAWCSWSVQTQNTVTVLDFFSLLFLSLLDQAVLPLTLMGPLWQLLALIGCPFISTPLYLVGVGSGDTKWSWFASLFEVIFIPSSAAPIIKLGWYWKD